MNNQTIVCCVVALLLGMLLANMLKNVCGCKLVEGQARHDGHCPSGDNEAGIKKNCDRRECEAITITGRHGGGHDPDRMESIKNCLAKGCIAHRGGNRCGAYVRQKSGGRSRRYN